MKISRIRFYKYVSTAIIGLFPIIAFCQNQEQIQDLSFGGSGAEGGSEVIFNDDASFYVLSESHSPQGSINKTTPRFGTLPSHADLWLILVGDNGDVIWDKSFGGSASETARALFKTDHALFLFGSSSSGISGNRTAVKKADTSSNDIWVVKTDLNGNIIWDKSFGGNAVSGVQNVIQTDDGNFVLAGHTNSSQSGDVSSPNLHGTIDPWILKIDTAGTVLWEKRYSTIESTSLFSVTEDDHGNLLIAASTNSPNDTLKNVPVHGTRDIWVLKLDETGEVLAQNSYGGANDEYSPRIHFHEGGYYLTCSSWSNLPSGNKTVANVGLYNVWLLKLGLDLSIKQQMVIGGDSLETGWDIKSVSKDKLALVISTLSNTGTGNWGQTQNYGQVDYLTVLIDTSLDVIFSHQTGGAENDFPGSITLSDDGEIVVCGSSASPQGGSRTATRKGTSDSWLVWLDTPVFTEEYHQPENSVVLYPNPAVHALHFESGSDYKNYMLFSITGEQLQSGRVTEGQNRIEVADLPSGMYIIRLEGEGVSFTKKWVKG